MADLRSNVSNRETRSENTVLVHAGEIQFVRFIRVV